METNQINMKMYALKAAGSGGTGDTTIGQNNPYFVPYAADLLDPHENMRM